MLRSINKELKCFLEQAARLHHAITKQISLPIEEAKGSITQLGSTLISRITCKSAARLREHTLGFAAQPGMRQG